MRIKACFDALKRDKKKALIPYLVAGDPIGMTVDIMHRWVEAGATILELGYPFSDPLADGPVIAKAHKRSLVSGMTLNKTLDLVAQFRKNDTLTPVILMGYLNPIVQMGFNEFSIKAAASGVDGVLVVDLPAHHAVSFVNVLQSHRMNMIYLVTPTTSDRRIEQICTQASGFIYYVSLTGVTGSSAIDLVQVRSRVNHVKTYTDLPISVGFGIRDSISAANISTVADGVVVGSVLVSDLSNNQIDQIERIDRSAHRILDMRHAMSEVG